MRFLVYFIVAAFVVFAEFLSADAHRHRHDRRTARNNNEGRGASPSAAPRGIAGRSITPNGPPMDRADGKEGHGRMIHRAGAGRATRKNGRLLIINGAGKKLDAPDSDEE